MTADNDFMDLYKNYDKVINRKDKLVEYEKKFHQSFCMAAKEPQYKEHILYNL